MSEPELRVHAFLPYSRANGPGLRAVIWVQGCTLGCPERFNPDTYPRDGGRLVSVDEVYRRIAGLGNTIEGITVSGGEPLQQARALTRLLRRLRNETPFPVLVFAGYTWEGVQSIPEAETLLSSIDVLIAGKYDHRQRFAHGLCGSANKTIHYLTDRCSQADVSSTPAPELILDCSGDVTITGVDPLRWQREGKRIACPRMEGAVGIGIISKLRPRNGCLPRGRIRRERKSPQHLIAAAPFRSRGLRTASWGL